MMMEPRRLMGYTSLLLCLTASLVACAAPLSSGEGEREPTEEWERRIGPVTATPMLLESAPTRSPAPAKTALPTLTVVADTEPLDRSLRLTPTIPPGVERVPATTSSAVIGEVPDDLLAELFDDVVARSGGEREAIDIVSAEAVVWRDGSLGCPQPGMMYTMALVAGYRVVLEVDGESYDYHANDGGYFFLCEGGAMDPMPTPSSVEEEVEMAPTASVSPGLQRSVDLAVDDLAARLAM